MLPKLQSSSEATLTEQFSPLYRKVSGLKKAVPEVSIQEDFTAVNSAIDKFETYLSDRMGVHQRELLGIMKEEIKRIIEDLKTMLKVYNQMVHEKNLSQELWETRNEVEYFKYEAIRLFKENMSYKKQIETLRQQIESLNFESICQESALKNIAHKLAKEKARKSHMERPRRHESLIMGPVSQKKSLGLDPSTHYTKKLDKSTLRVDSEPDEVKLNKTEMKEKMFVNPFTPKQSDRLKLLRQKFMFSKKVQA